MKQSETMKHGRGEGHGGLVIAWVLALLFTLAVFPLVAMTQDQTGRDQATIRNSLGDGALPAPVDSHGRHENEEGIGHYHNGEWDLAAHHFRRALLSDPGMAEAHFNLALALMRLGKHQDATKEFKKAVDLAPLNPQISESTILNEYLGQ